MPQKRVSDALTALIKIHRQLSHDILFAHAKCSRSDCFIYVNCAALKIHARKRTSLSEALFLGICFHITAKITFLKISKIWLYSITIKLL